MKEVLSVPHLKVLFMNFIKYFFSTYWENYIVFLFYSVNIIELNLLN